jgi:hypothetical protein
VGIDQINTNCTVYNTSRALTVGPTVVTDYSRKFYIPTKGKKAGQGFDPDLVHTHSMNFGHVYEYLRPTHCLTFSQLILPMRVVHDHGGVTSCDPFNIAIPTRLELPCCCAANMFNHILKYNISQSRRYLTHLYTSNASYSISAYEATVLL